MNEETKNSHIAPRTSFDVVSAIDSLATEARRERESAEDILNFDKQKQDIRARIISAAKVRGEDFTEEDLTKAVDLYFDRQYRFVETPETFKTRLLDAYINRRRLGKKYGIPALVGLLAAGAIWATTSIVRNTALNIAEGNVETHVQNSRIQRDELSSILQKDYAVVNAKDLPASEKTQALVLLNCSGAKLSGMDDFFSEFCPKGNSVDAITRGNYIAVKTQVEGIDSSLVKVKQNLEEVKGIVELQDSLDSAKVGLEALMVEVRNSNPPNILAQRAQTAYQSGLANINARNFSDVKANETQLRQVIADVRQFAILPSEEAKIYSAIMAVIAKDEKEGIAMADALHQEAQTYINCADVARLASVVGKMNEENATLNQSYSIRIVSRDGVKSGIDRYYQGRFSGWYLVVEAVDSSNGSIVPVNIVNSENGATARVSMWGERVHGTDPNIVDRIQNGYSDDSLLVRVIIDKMDNGIVDHSLVGEKNKGHLRYKLNSSDFEGKQITVW